MFFLMLQKHIMPCLKMRFQNIITFYLNTIKLLIKMLLIFLVIN